MLRYLLCCGLWQLINFQDIAQTAETFSSSFDCVWTSSCLHEDNK